MFSSKIVYGAWKLWLFINRKFCIARLKNATSKPRLTSNTFDIFVRKYALGVGELKLEFESWKILPLECELRSEIERYSKTMRTSQTMIDNGIVGFPPTSVQD